MSPASRHRARLSAYLLLSAFMAPVLLPYQAKPQDAKAQTVQDDPADRLSIPVTAEQAEKELRERERLNREQAEFAARQLAENEASRQAVARAVAEREAIIARQREEQAAAEAAWKAEVDRRAREYEEAMARWRADVAACQAGDFSRCAKP
ncbi:MAG: hypothetical protein N2Z59_05490 [Alteraurantiacibacter sp.]|nr:hypothetical protein [Alteraurantiacibacter sp.]